MRWLRDMPTFDRGQMVTGAVSGAAIGVLVGVFVNPLAATIVASLVFQPFDHFFFFLVVMFYGSPISGLIGALIGARCGLLAARRYRDSHVIIEEMVGDTITGGDCE